MTDDSVPLTDPTSSPPDPNDPPIESAQPYRTPATLEGTVGTAASRKPLMILGLVLVLVSIAAAGTFLLLTPSVRDFGENRARPIRDLPQYVEDFGGTRMTEDEYNMLHGAPAGADTSEPELSPSADVGDT